MHSTLTPFWMLGMLALLVVGGGAMVLGLIVLAIVKKRLSIAVVGIGLLVATLLTVGLFAFYYTARSADAPPVATIDSDFGYQLQQPPRLSSNGIQQFQVSDGGIVVRSNPSWGVSMAGVLFIALIFVFVMSLVVRLASPRGAGRHPRVLVGLLAAVVLGFLLLSAVGVRVKRSANYSEMSIARNAEMQRDIQRQQAEAQKQIERQQAEVHKQMERQQAEVQRHMQQQQWALSEHLVTAATDLQKRIANADIHDLIDQVDAPQIEVTHPATTEGDKKTDPKSADNSQKKPAAKKADDSNPAAPATKKTDAKSIKKPKSKKPAPPEPKQTAVATTTPAKPESTPTRPSWVDTISKRVGDTWREVVATDEFSTIEECRREADRLLLAATYEHLTTLIGNEGSSQTVTPLVVRDSDGWVSSTNMSPITAYLRRLGITPAYIRQHIAKDEFIEKTERSVGPMLKLYTLIEFSPSVDRDIMRNWAAMERSNRFAMLGAGAGCVLGLLTLVFGLLKVDTLTKGYYTKRLFIGVPAAIIIGAFVVLLIAMN